MTGHGSKFGRKKEDAIAALLSQRSIEEAARAAGVGYKTLLRWHQVPEFEAALRKARRDAVGQSTGRLQQGASAAATTLLKVMLDPGTPASTKVRAAECVLNHAQKAIELEDIEARVSELERASEEANRGK
jgi:molybdenum-dependent DNA-binding transcriptional regulator ModE